METLAWLLPLLLFGGLGAWWGGGILFDAWLDRTQNGGVR